MVLILNENEQVQSIEKIEKKQTQAPLTEEKKIRQGKRKASLKKCSKSSLVAQKVKDLSPLQLRPLLWHRFDL